MYNIKTLNKIAPCGLKYFTSDKYSVSDDCANPDGIVLRSFSMHDMELPENLKAVARAGAGTNNIPIDKCSEKGIVVFNTPGANANAVKELTLAGLFLASRDIVNGIDWAKTLKGQGAEVGKMVEKGKSNYAGNEIEGKTLVVLGLGAIGVMVANAAYHLGLDVIGYDPYISVKAALNLNRHVQIKNDLLEAVACADFVSIHVPLMDATRGMINEDAIAAMPDGVKILNFARGELCDNDAMAKALSSGKIAKYVTDFPNDAVLGMENVIAIPHLGASTQESEDNCAVMASKQIIDFLENGNIVNSVNFPACEMVRDADVGARITVAHKNVPNMLAQFLKVIGDTNIHNMTNKSKGDLAYTIIDIENDVPNLAQTISEIPEVLNVRIIK